MAIRPRTLSGEGQRVRRLLPFIALLVLPSAWGADVTDPKALLPLCRALEPHQSVTLSTDFSSLPTDVAETLHTLGCDARMHEHRVALRRADTKIDADGRLENLFAKLLAPRTEGTEALQTLRRIEDLLLAHTPSEAVRKRMVEEWIPMARIKYRKNVEVQKALEKLRRALRPDDLGWS